MNKEPHISHKEYSLNLGGPLYQFYLFAGLLKKPLLLCKRRIIVVCGFTWLPLFLLAAFNGVAFGNVQMPFIFDFDVHVRFLLSLALLIFAEVIAHERIHIIVEQFFKCHIIAPNDEKKFNDIIVSAVRFRNSSVVEILLIVLVYTIGYSISTKYLPLAITNWYATQLNDVTKLTPAGYWYLFVSLPIFQFMILRWYFRMIVWYRFLWQISRLPLRLNSLHPDHAGGLGFIATSIFAFEPFLLAHSFLLAGMIFNRIYNTGATLMDFQLEIFGVLIFLIILPLTPMLFFIPALIKSKRSGTLDYSVTATQYVNEFRQKWIESKIDHNKSLLGSSDIQSLADLTNSYEVSNHMRITPFERNNLIALVILTILPLLPLILTIIPLEKIIRQTVALIF